jgi:hypothetical protein
MKRKKLTAKLYASKSQSGYLLVSASKPTRSI